MDSSETEVTFTYSGKAVKWQTLERARDYETAVLFVELEGVSHAGYLMKKGSTVVAKGEVAKAVRDAGIRGVEMAAAPPPDTNAVIMLRATPDVGSVMDAVLEVVFRVLKEKGLF
ncbi:hypothetical protein [Geoglobus sp.]